MSKPNTVSAAAAARLAGVGRTTIMRRLAEGTIPGATQNADGRWQITVEGLQEAGFHPSTEATPAPVDTVARLRQELADERRRREVAEAIAEERAARIRDLRKMLRDAGA